MVAAWSGVQTAAQEPASAAKRAEAVRVPAGTIEIDGRLDEAAWQTAPPVTDFIQKEPVEGAPPTDRFEVRFVYDDSAVYVGARMFSSVGVQGPLSRRDDGDQIESLQIGQHRPARLSGPSARCRPTDPQLTLAAAGPGGAPTGADIAPVLAAQHRRIAEAQVQLERYRLGGTLAQRCR